MTQARHGRRGSVFSVRLTDEERAELDALQAADQGPRSLGAWLVWRARAGSTVPSPVLPARAGSTVPGPVLPRRQGSTPAIADRLILDLCGGSGAWSRPYRDAGYRVQVVTLPDHDIRYFEPPSEPVHGILAAPPCTEFSLAKNGRPRDIRAGLEIVSACLRVVVACRPTWWALENPVGLLSQWLGTPRDVWEPCDFGDPWTKRTAIWGDFVIPTRGPFVKPLGGGPFCRVCDPGGTRRAWCNRADHRAVTPAGFARAFAAANP